MLSLSLYWHLDEFRWYLYSLLVFMHRSTTSFQSSNKFWNLAVGCRKQSSLHAESIKGSDIWWEGSQVFRAICISTARNVFASGGRRWEWVDLGIHLWTTDVYNLELGGNLRYTVLLPLCQGAPAWAGFQSAAADHLEVHKALSAPLLCSEAGLIMLSQYCN